MITDVGEIQDKNNKQKTIINLKPENSKHKTVRQYWLSRVSFSAFYTRTKMNLSKEKLLKLTLLDKVYHPFYGEGRIQELREYSLKVKFEKSVNTFECSGSYGETKFISELYTKPIMVVEQAGN